MFVWSSSGILLCLFPSHLSISPFRLAALQFITADQMATDLQHIPITFPLKLHCDLKFNLYCYSVFHMLPEILLFLMPSDFDIEQMRSNRLLTLQRDSVKSKIIMLMNVSATQGQSLPFSPLNTLIHSKYGLTPSGPAFSVVRQAWGGGGSEAQIPKIKVNINQLK